MLLQGSEGLPSAKRAYEHLRQDSPKGTTTAYHDIRHQANRCVARPRYIGLDGRIRPRRRVRELRGELCSRRRVKFTSYCFIPHLYTLYAYGRRRPGFSRHDFGILCSSVFEAATPLGNGWDGRERLSPSLEKDPHLGPSLHSRFRCALNVLMDQEPAGPT